MTGMGFSPDGQTRIFAFFMASAIHVAAGWALLSYPPAGTPVRGDRDRSWGKVLVVELIPLDREGVSRQEAIGDAGNAKTPEKPQFLKTGGNGMRQSPAKDDAVG